ncbi:hypothetical protein LZ554_000013 [Drepanopeziza brunnea f. sp. 'monogermtubi']|nr:hypothetical protein LZ554_000013 [Drepanopeziza brunnea f. sp. 'monogermtubi']
MNDEAPIGIPINYIINHCFLPPKLPSYNDTNTEVEVCLTTFFHDAILSFINLLPEEEHDAWNGLPSMLSILLDRGTRASPVRTLDQKLHDMVEGDVLALHITQQNAGLLIRKLPQRFQFESFELSAKSQVVMSTVGRLVRSFPGAAIAVDQTKVSTPGFRDVLTETLSALESEVMDESLSKGPGHAPRDSVSPHFVTEWLPGILRGLGSPVAISRIHKRTRDEVIFGGGPEPFRRSPRWLLLKVALQTTLADQKRYKIFMIYFMATALERAVTADISSDKIHVMLAKIARRILKLGFIIKEDAPWAHQANLSVMDTMESAQRLIQKRWSAVQRSADSVGTFRLSELKKVNPRSDTTLRLANLRKHLERLRSLKLERRDVKIFNGNCGPRLNGRGSSLPDHDSLILHSPVELSLRLMDMEHWAANCLDSWLTRNIESKKHLTKLARCIEWYIKASASVYDSHPQNFSVKILTLMLLWTALDKGTVFHYPLLSNFDPGFPPTICDSLLLPKREQMTRLRDVEKHLLKRKANSVVANPSIFSDITSPLSFGAQFFDRSPSLQDLKNRIEMKASDNSRAKRKELQELKSRYHRLITESNALSCTTVKKWYGKGRNRTERTVHDPHCLKCSNSLKAQAMRIDTFEWPLPSLEPAAKAVVFELEIPSLIRSWRSVSYQILADVLNPLPVPQSRSKSLTLDKYEGLKDYVKQNVDRLEVVLKTRPLAQTAGRAVVVSEATEETVCLENHLKLAMQDSLSQQLTVEHLGQYDISERCSLKIAHSSIYFPLQYAVSGTNHTSNEVISGQWSCPDGLTIHEYHAFAMLRSGHRLQWLNIAREIITRTLNFGTEEVFLLIIQACWQAGPPSLQQVSRDSHVELEEESFGLDLLSAMNEGLVAVDSNWQGSVAALTYISLAARLLSMSLHESVRDRCLRFLQKARLVTIKWLRVVVKLLHEATDEAEMEYLTLRALDLAMICHCTFDIDHRQLPDLLSSEENIAILIEAAATVNDRWPVSEDSLTTFTRELLQRFLRTSHALERPLKDKILASPDGINDAVKRMWAGYEIGTPWQTVQAPEDRWITTRTARTEEGSSSTVHFNLLTGELLIDGLPLARLPRDFENHITYRRIFGNKILEVIPSSRGLSFETRNAVHGFSVHFALQDGELVVRAVRGIEIYEVLPLTAVEGDFPRTLVNNYVHWVHIRSMEIEFRGLDSKWIPSSENWRISNPEDPNASTLTLGKRHLVEPQSPTARVVHSWLKPLESEENINIYYNGETEETEVSLPRMNLDFVLRHTGLESRQFRGHIVDNVQYVGTLHGLRTKLVLRDMEKHGRVVIVPHGSVTYHPHLDHVRVEIATGRGGKVSYHQFVIDKDLGMLTDNGNLRSRLFKLYLHALTSHCLPDSLTSRTGSEEALYGLRLASTRSFLDMDQDHIEQLKLFAKLTPSRVFCPKGSKFMQIVRWENLSPLSHHEEFVKEARLILLQADTYRMFQTASSGTLAKPKVENRGSDELQTRAAIRNASFRVCPFGAEQFTPTHDVVYDEARDSIPNSPRELGACHIATLVEKWSCRLTPYTNLFRQFEQWAQFGSIVHGSRPGFKMRFEKKWLEYPSRFMLQNWCSMHSALSSSDSTIDKFRIIMFLATLAESRYDTKPLVGTLLALATAPALRDLHPPQHEHFDLSKGYEPDEDLLHSILERCKVAFENSPEKDIARSPNEDDQDLSSRRRATYQATTNLQVKNCLKSLIDQWPTKVVGRPRSSQFETYLPGLKVAIEQIRSLFLSWYKNREFQKYIEDVQSVLDSLPQRLPMPAPYLIERQNDEYKTARTCLTIEDLLQNPAPDIPLPKDELGIFVCASQTKEEEVTGLSKLKALLTKLSKFSNGQYQNNYIKDLRKSYNALLANKFDSPQLASDGVQKALKGHLDQCRSNVESLYRQISSRLILSSSSIIENAKTASVLPRFSPSILLRLLARSNPVALSNDWKVALTRYALAIAEMQRAERLVACGKRDSDILNELTNTGHKNWDPMEYPEWLLLELENNILIRPEQAQIAREMISPRTGSNSIMQLNMGLGKSSVVVPIVAATLADGSKLARVVCLKSLSEQMFQLLVSKLGGLLGRRIYRLPISRSLKPTLHCAELIQNTYNECMASGGILLVQPESLLSFELLGVDYLLSKDLVPQEQEDDPVPGQPQESMHETGRVMVRTQQWLYQNARDILDESDEILSVRFELIYTLGMQQKIEFSPDRWVIIQKVLSIFSETAQDILEEFPQGLEFIEAFTGAFPRIRILQEEAGKSLLGKVAKALCRSGLTSLPMWTFDSEEQQCIWEYVTDLNISKSRASILADRVFKTDFTRMSLLLLRGLFAAGVLELVFGKKRWRVNYGLDLGRSMLAVPYHAKDNPSPRSEFSHPDTAIALTCLSYYYSGLNDEQIYACFEELLVSDHAQEDYIQWVQYCEDLPKTFKRLSAVNLRDKHQCTHELFPKIRFSKGLIDYYLQHLVFPKQMKEFSNKLSSSGWEIARKKRHPTTGFSGTNDSKYMLPIPIKQCELPEQLSTNAEVLACILRPENSYDTVHTPQLESINASALIDVTIDMNPPVRVILDVGAQLLEDNEIIATSWLQRVDVKDAQAVVYFQDNELYVLNREGGKEPLQISPFAKQMDQVLVYLDEAHTRGTDLKMPADYRAIVTLGPDLTKDRLAQACMRMRKLGRGQSVVFCSPQEVQSKILECSGKEDAERIEVEDVLLWTMRNSWEFTKKGIPLWATQGMRHYRRRAACDLSGDVPQIPVGVLEPEALTLEERYGLSRQSLDENIICRNRITNDNDVTRAEICSIRAKCREFGLNSFGDSDLHEEQERELHPENEREVQVEPPPPSRPCKHTLHAGIKELVRTGRLNSQEGVTPAFKLFSFTRARESLNVDEWPVDLLMSEDFAATVLVPEVYDEGDKGQFLRPVNWLISFKGANAELRFLIISPFEVQELLPLMRGQDRVRLHTYSARLSLANKSIEDLSYCSVPPVGDDWLIPAISTTLNLFAGQLYLRDAAEYHKLCRFLGVRFKQPYKGVKVFSDGWISPESRVNQDDATAQICKFNSSPIDFLRLIISFRRLGQTFSTSHMGKIVSGELLMTMDFEKDDRLQEVVDDPMDVDDDEDTIVVKPEPGLTEDLYN